jgi:GDP-L-fucose synthase
VQAIRRQHGLRYMSAMPTNLYGPGDNFHPLHSHVMPGMIRRFYEAQQSGATSVTCWGSGAPRREFLHVDDFAAACLFLLENYDSGDPINVGTGVDQSIAEIAELVAETVGFDGVIEWDASKPDGTPRKLLDVSRLNELGWKAQTPLPEGLRTTHEWFLDHQDEFRR